MAVLSTSWPQRPSSLREAHQEEWNGSALQFLAMGALITQGFALVLWTGKGPQPGSLRRLENCEIAKAVQKIRPQGCQENAQAANWISFESTQLHYEQR